MDNFALFLVRFVYRDLVYMLGGVLTLSSAVHGPDFAAAAQGTSTLSGPVVAVVAGLCWVIGYVIQESATLIGLVNTSLASTQNPSRILSKAYQRLVGTPFELNRASPTTSELEQLLNDHSVERAANFERTIGLMMVGTCMGPSCLVAALAIGARTMFDPTPGAFALIVILLSFACVLLVLAKLKFMQMQAQRDDILSALKESDQGRRAKD